MVDLQALSSWIDSQAEILKSRLTVSGNVNSKDEEEDPFIHTSLSNPLDPIIRVLELHPSKRDDRLECTIKQVNLLDQPAYEALSYTWNDSKYDHHHGGFRSLVASLLGEPQVESQRVFCIYCDGKPLAIGPGLCAALKRLRHSTERRTLWIDQICIDQENIAERNTQVQAMLHIYRRASGVILWVGEEESHTATAFEIISKLASLYPMLDIDVTEIMANVPEGGDLDVGLEKAELLARQTTNKEIPTPQSVMENKKHGLPPLDKWHAVAYFYGRPVFGRIWIVQEICAARNVTVLCGSHQIDWHKVAKAAKFLKDPAWNKIYAKISGALDDDRKKGHKPLRIMKLDSVITFIRWRQHFHTSAQPKTWKEVFYTAKRYDATDPKDKIYAVLGTGKGNPRFIDSSKTIIPNYRKTVAQVFTEAVKFALIEDKSLDLLYIRQDISFDVTQGLPSWVADFVPTDDDPGNIPEDALCHSCHNSPYHAAGDSAPQLSWPHSSDPAVLATQSFQLDTVKQISVECDGAYCGGAIFEWSDLVVHNSKAETYVTGEELLSAFWRTCICNLSPSGKYPVPESCFKEFCGFVGTYFMSEREKRTDDPKLSHISLLILATALSKLGEDEVTFNLMGWFSTTMRRRFYITERGYFGLGPRSVKPGDQIHILSGGPVPFVLRAIDGNGNTTANVTDTSGRYSLIGATYTHGLMNGEGLVRDDFNWSNITIR